MDTHVHHRPRTSSHQPPARVRIGRLSIDAVSFEQALDAIEDLVESGTGGSVFTPNVDHVVGADRNDAFALAYANASLTIADGMPLVWASRVLGTRLPERVAGSDVIDPLLERAARRGWRVAFIGAGPGVAEKAAAVVRERYGTDVVDTWDPVVDLADDQQIEAIVERLQACQPQLVLMAFGAPKQELLIDRIRDRVRPAVLVGVGASLDFIAGTVRRAPRVMRSTGTEWLYRLVQEPRRLWRRYLVNDPKFAWILVRTIREERRAR